MLGRTGGAGGRGAGAGIVGAGLGIVGIAGLGTAGATGLGAGAAALGAAGFTAAGLGAAGFAAAALGAAALGLAALRAFGLDLAFAFLPADFFALLFFATARFFLRAGMAFFVFLAFFAFLALDFLVFDFAFFAMIVLPIVSAQISVRLERIAVQTGGALAPIRTTSIHHRDALHHRGDLKFCAQRPAANNGRPIEVAPSKP